MSQININKFDFFEIMQDEIAFYNKRFVGDDDIERDRVKKRFLARYYETLSHVKAYQLKSALKSCAERFEHFPKISQILKFCPIKQIEKAYEPDYVKPAPIPAKMKKQLKNMKQGPSKTKLSKKMMDDMKIMCRDRFSGNWDETFKRWDLENEARMDAQ